MLTQRVTTSGARTEEEDVAHFIRVGPYRVSHLTLEISLRGVVVLWPQFVTDPS